MARLFLLDVINDDAREIQCAGLDDYYKYLQCDCFDIANRSLDDKRFDIFVDDEGLLKDDPIISAINTSLEPMLVGNLIFANHDWQGNTTSLSDDDIATIKKHIAIMKTIQKNGRAERVGRMIVGLDY